MTDEQLAVAKTAPAIAGATIYGFTLQDWVAVATLVYVALQVGLLMPKYLAPAIWLEDTWPWRSGRSQELRTP